QSAIMFSSRGDFHFHLAWRHLNAGRMIGIRSAILPPHASMVGTLLTLNLDFTAALLAFGRSFEFVGHDSPTGVARFVATRHGDFRILGGILVSHDFHFV